MGGLGNCDQRNPGIQRGVCGSGCRFASGSSNVLLLLNFIICVESKSPGLQKTKIEETLKNISVKLSLEILEILRAMSSKEISIDTWVFYALRRFQFRTARRLPSILTGTYRPALVVRGASEPRIRRYRENAERERATPAAPRCYHSNGTDDSFTKGDLVDEKIRVPQCENLRCYSYDEKMRIGCSV